ncbi:hypothetical protein F0U60_44985 [Archangium minus]|uniref:Double-GTPase 2 domain-containing protein n=1 Tax=Archangium minus TaxID=83450 RepID=A0ABY9X543_9BACT|nr:hypothetical protein F0U60_44985 [Archangium minus]
MATTETRELQCVNPECRVAETGKCVEGYALNQCPHFGRVAPESKEIRSDNNVSAAESTEQVDQGITLPSGERLSTVEASSILRAGEARVIAIIGPTEAGKTTLIASIYDLFQNGPVDELHFARSRTLSAFEQACHHARAASMRTTPHTERTLLSAGIGFYHLGIQNRENSTSVDMLLADRAGEEYRSAADTPSAANEFVEIHRADTITTLVDGRRLLDTGERHNIRSEIELILQAFIDSSVVTPGQRVALVLTKLDEVKSSSAKERAERDFSTLVQSVRRLFGETFSEIEEFRVAASPVTDLLPRGYGIPALLRFWIAATPFTAPAPLSIPRVGRAMSRLTIVEE